MHVVESCRIIQTAELLQNKDYFRPRISCGMEALSPWNVGLLPGIFGFKVNYCSWNRTWSVCGVYGTCRI